MNFISAPFGNYLRYKNATSVTGSWTLAPRPGLVKQIVKTLRYTRTGWRNKIGLRNKGIRYALKKHKKNQVMSLAAVDAGDWLQLHKYVPENTSVEINISCPNIEQQVNQLLTGFDLWPSYRRKWCIAKISPTADEKLVDKLVDSGYNSIHASNTLHTEKGGLSGKVLVPHTLRLVKYIKKTHPHVQVIAGGGVTCKEDVQNYTDAGANHISLGTVCFTPWKIGGLL